VQQQGGTLLLNKKPCMAVLSSNFRIDNAVDSWTMRPLKNFHLAGQE
jgi:hypothetical protein